MKQLKTGLFVSALIIGIGLSITPADAAGPVVDCCDEATGMNGGSGYTTCSSACDIFGNCVKSCSINAGAFDECLADSGMNDNARPHIVDVRNNVCKHQLNILEEEGGGDPGPIPL